ncbi:4cfe8c87-f4d6-4d1b-aa7b-9c8e5a879032 [Thermothielavioides terrestris]|uniref:4cfe8c87-f4d6-4d1b-aa7b-9c8e5a879032 n=1 Tax=Thermothielavioides terrestris TaxID=2587410 RepID=A0A446BKS8_9PEZI|nr:4cfe8c87-f4d6-4d1b-aa7b-9c8e5a879032 [Thermothielavioides terrestris]
MAEERVASVFALAAHIKYRLDKRQAIEKQSKRDLGQLGREDLVDCADQSVVMSVVKPLDRDRGGLVCRET